MRLLFLYIHRHLPFRHHAHALMEVFAHGDGFLADMIIKVHVFKELLSDHLQGVFWPGLAVINNYTQTNYYMSYISMTFSKGDSDYF